MIDFYEIFLGDFLVLKPFPGKPILDRPDFRDPLFKKCDRGFLIWGGRDGSCFLYLDKMIDIET